MKYFLPLLLSLLLANTLNAGSSGGTMGLQMESQAALQATRDDLSSLDVLMRSNTLSTSEAELVSKEITSTRLRLNALMNKLQENGAPVEAARAEAIESAPQK